MSRNIDVVLCVSALLIALGCSNGTEGTITQDTKEIG